MQSANMKSCLVKISSSSNCLTAFVIGLVSIILDYVFADLEKSNSLKSQLIIHGIVPEVLRESPPNEIQVIFSQGSPFELAKKLSPSESAEPPIQVSYPAHEKGYYFLALIDPDSPNRKNPVDREYLHWLVGNIPGVAVSRGADLMPYLPPSPAKDTGVHRYVFIVYHQPKGVINFKDQLEFAKKPNNQGRRKFNSTEFAQKYGLGDVIAASFFRMEWDKYYENSTIK